MKRSGKIILGIFITIIIIGTTLGSTAIIMYNRHNNNKITTLDPPIINFPMENTDFIHIIWGYGIQNGAFHNGIDFGCNASVNIIAWCNMTVIDITTFYNEPGGHWQTNVFLEFNERFTFDCAFESWALNETFGNYQRDAINVIVGQTILQGEVLGLLLNHGSGTHIHFGMHDLGESVCAYHYYTEEAKTIFNPLWEKYGWGDDSWYT